MPSCVFRKCTNYTATVKDRSDVSFHALPRGELMREKWIRIIRSQRREDDWMPSSYTSICSQHFLEDDVYVTHKNVRRLKKTAVPLIEIQTGHIRIKIEKKHFPEEPTTSSAGVVPLSKVKKEIVNADSDDPLQTSRCDSPSGLSDIGSSDLEGALDTPAVLLLKKQLREKEELCHGLKIQLKEKEDFCQKYVKRIKLLQKTNKRLSEKNVTLRQVLTKMKRKLLNLNSNSDAKVDSDVEESKPSQDS